MLQDRAQMVALEDVNALINKSESDNKIKNNIQILLTESKYGACLPKITDCVMASTSCTDLFTGLIHNFGRTDGLEIYLRVKSVLEEILI